VGRVKPEAAIVASTYGGGRGLPKRNVTGAFREVSFESRCPNRDDGSTRVCDGDLPREHIDKKVLRIRTQLTVGTESISVDVIEEEIGLDPDLCQL